LLKVASTPAYAADFFTANKRESSLRTLRSGSKRKRETSASRCVRVSPKATERVATKDGSSVGAISATKARRAVSRTTAAWRISPEPWAVFPYVNEKSIGDASQTPRAVEITSIATETIGRNQYHQIKLSDGFSLNY
jgi:hypothetical protein